MDAASLYNADFHAWSEHQAAVLRRLPRGPVPLPNDLDLEHVAEEIEDLGNAERNAVASMLRQFFVHAVKLHAMPCHSAARHWMSEANTFLDQAADRYTPSMAQRIELQPIWRRAVDRVAADLDSEGADASVQAAVVALAARDCPFGIGDLLHGTPRAERLIGFIPEAP